MRPHISAHSASPSVPGRLSCPGLPPCRSSPPCARTSLPTLHPLPARLAALAAHLVDRLPHEVLTPPPSQWPPPQRPPLRLRLLGVQGPKDHLQIPCAQHLLMHQPPCLVVAHKDVAPQPPRLCNCEGGTGRHRRCFRQGPASRQVQPSHRRQQQQQSSSRTSSSKTATPCCPAAEQIRHCQCRTSGPCLCTHQAGSHPCAPWPAQQLASPEAHLTCSMLLLPSSHAASAPGSSAAQQVPPRAGPVCWVQGGTRLRPASCPPPRTPHRCCHPAR